MARDEDQDRTYHGIGQRENDDDEQEWQPARIQAERTEFGPTQRLSVSVLRVFDESEDGDFGWGHNGGGASRAAAVILADALNVDHDTFSVSAYPQDEIDSQLREDFCTDVLSQMCEEFRLRRGAVLRWARGWYAHYEIVALPTAVAQRPRINGRPY